MDVDGWMDEVFGDFIGLIPSHNYNGNNIIADNNKKASDNKEVSDNKEAYEKDFLMIANNKNDVADKNFRVQLDVSQFSPEEINIRVVGRDLVIDGKHEERRDDHGFISRSFSRRYTLPENMDEQRVACQLSKDGKLLKLEAPKKEAIEDTPQEWIITIEWPAEDTVGSDPKKVSAGFLMAEVAKKIYLITSDTISRNFDLFKISLPWHVWTLLSMFCTW